MIQSMRFLVVLNAVMQTVLDNLLFRHIVYPCIATMKTDILVCIRRVFTGLWYMNE
jgi:hypothetical protein